MSASGTPAQMPGQSMPAAVPQPPGQPPIGSSPASGPAQNLGMAAKGVQAVGALLNAMAMVIPLVGAQSPVGQALAKAMIDVGKHIPPGASTPQGENNFIKEMALKQQQMGPQRAAIASQQPAMAGATPMPQQAAE